MLTLHPMTTDTTLTLWWNKPDNAEPQQRYEVLLNGQLAAVVNRTHCTLRGLQPDTAYEAAVRMNGRTVSVQASTRQTLRRLDVTQAPYHAKGDGVTLNTAALQQAMDDCGPEECVYLPAGVYLTGSLRLHSHMALCIDEGAVLRGTQTISDYLPRIPSRFEGTEMLCYSSVLNLGHMDHAAGPNCEDVLIYGGGTIESGGRVLAHRIIEDERIRLQGYIASLGDKVLECENMDTIPGRVRPRLINMSNCRNIRLTGLTLQNGASWNVHMIYCTDIVTDHCTFRSEDVWNGDGWDPDSSECCTIFGCYFFTGDDSVAIKSGKNPEGNVISRPSRNICVFDCMSAFGHGVTIGSEMSGGVEDVYIWDCDLGKSLYGLEIKGTKKRGGYVRGVHMRHCVVPRVLMHAVGYNDDGVGAQVPPVFSDCTFDGVTLLGRCLGHDRQVTHCAAIELCGFDAPGHEIRSVAFRNCRSTGASEVKMHLCRDITLELNEIE